MRLKVSDEVVVFDGSGKEYVGVVSQVGRKSLSLDIIKIRNPGREQKYSITLIQAIPKKEKMDYIVEKATELGVKHIMPVVTARTIPDWSEAKKAAILARWRRISQEAAKQCGRTDLAEIMPVMTLEDALCHCESRQGGTKQSQYYDLKLIAALSDKAVRLKDALKNCNVAGRITIAIGPEGDFTGEEIARAEAEGFKTVNLGPNVLKSDTAGLAALAMINYELQE